ncbi:RNA-binding protein 4.1-like [Antennarius striatus]|uniref:RNA-binding protein 4.1-like n=1 Tax=Antennarius striatus TaxID=241820 RepID=UPI0035B439B5
MVKIFIGNLSQHTGKDEVEALFTPYGSVTECAKYKNYAFVHMEDRKSATKAIRELHLYKLNGRPINVEPSRGRGSYQGPVKIHIANIEKGFDKELREMFEEYGTVTECAIIKNFAFVHMLNADEAMDAIQGLDNSEFQGKRIHVQVSKSRPRGGPEEEDFPPPPGRGGYYPPRHPMDQPEPSYRGRMPAYPSLPPLPAPPRRVPYPDRGYGERDGYGVVDYYERFRPHPQNTAGYNDGYSGAIPPPPPPPSALVRERLGMGANDPYNRYPLPPPPQPSMVKDRSPIRRAPAAPAPPPAGNGYSYERSRLSPLSRTPMYSTPNPMEPVSETVPTLPPTATPRYTGY